MQEFMGTRAFFCDKINYMKQGKKLIVGNWKMNPSSTQEAKQIFNAIRKVGSALRNVQTVICPPFLYIESLKKLLTGHRVVLGAQDMFWDDPPAGGGAYTGEISPKMLAGSGIGYVILGHSERRALGETNEVVNKKVKACFKYNITPILCVGELNRDSERNYLNFIREELEESLAGIPKTALAKVVLAYEPIWAVGKDAKREATPEECLEMILFIKKELSDLFGVQAVEGLQTLYGGSVDTKKEVEGFLKQGGVDGLLVGRASLNPNVFEVVLKTANDL